MVSVITAIAAAASSFGAASTVFADTVSLDNDPLTVAEDTTQPFEDFEETLVLPNIAMGLSEDNAPDSENADENSESSDGANEGEEDAPTPTPEIIEISTADELQSISQSVPLDENNTQSFAGKIYRLTNDIDLEGAELNRIGLTYVDIDGESTPIYNFFDGTFDGNGHTISNFTLTSIGQADSTGIFPALNGTVTNLKLDNFTVDLTFDYAFTDSEGNALSSASVFVGVLSGYSNEAVITDCSVTNFNVTVNVTEECQAYVYAGIISAYSGSPDIERCSVDGSLSFTSTSAKNASFGGIIGESANVYLKDCSSSVDITYTTGSGTAIGGIIGHSPSGSITGCSYDGTINVTAAGAAYLGGIEGQNLSTEISDCAVSKTEITAQALRTYIGGIEGYSSGGAVDGCDVSKTSLSSTTASYQSTIGGICGQNIGTVKNCTVSANINGTVTGKHNPYVGGIVGLNGNSSNTKESTASIPNISIENCVYSGNGNTVTSYSGNARAFLGGITGFSYAPAIIKGCYADLSGLTVNTYSGSYVDVGGIAGCAYGSDISQCTASGELTAAYIGSMGGIVGTVSGHKYYVKNGDAAEYHSKGAVISDCISTVNIYASESTSALKIGGLVGYLYGAAAYDEVQPTITRCVASGDVTFTLAGYVSESHFVGGAVGYIVDSAAQNVHASGTVSAYRLAMADDDTTDDSNIYIGGFAGRIKENSQTATEPLSTVTDCYADTALQYTTIADFVHSGGFTESAQSNQNEENPVAPLISDCYYKSDIASSSAVGTAIATSAVADKASYNGFDFGTTWCISDNGAYLRTETSSVYDYEYEYDSSGTPTAISSFKLSQPKSGAKIYVALYDDLFGSSDVPSDIEIIDITESSNSFSSVDCDIEIPYGSEKIAVYYWDAGNNEMKPLMTKLLLSPEINNDVSK
jgi:hypothetical protein